VNRRLFLKGLGGIMVGLPILEGLGRGPKGGVKVAAAAQGPAYAIFMKQANGVMQAGNHFIDGKEPEMFWPNMAPGPITTATLAAQTGRTLADLSAYASKLCIVKGMAQPPLFLDQYGNIIGGHGRGAASLLTAAKLQTNGSDVEHPLALGESLDNRIVRQLTPGVEPLLAHAGPRNGFTELNSAGGLSYRGPLQPRTSEQDPYNIYLRLFAGNTGGTDPAAQQRLAASRKSVNDQVRTQLTALMSRPELSATDKQRLDQHFQSIRDVEAQLGVACTVANPQPFKDLSPNAGRDADAQAATLLHLDLISLAVACGATRVAILELGSSADITTYTIGGQVNPDYHMISHRLFGEGSTGAPMTDAQARHHAIDRMFAGHFKYLLDKLTAYGVLDQGVSVWTNEQGDGGHSPLNIPFIMAGSCNGFLKTGQFVDVGGAGPKGTPLNKILNTIGAAVGLKNAAGGPLDDFGDPSLPKGFVTQCLA
jgi:Protein of unknown function (DUF1552)